MARVMNGVKKASKKLKSQLEEVLRAPCLALVAVGKVSPTGCGGGSQ